MKQVQKTLGRLVQRIVGKPDREAIAKPLNQASELGAHALRQVSGGTAGSQSPTKGW